MLTSMDSDLFFPAAPDLDLTIFIVGLCLAVLGFLAAAFLFAADKPVFASAAGLPPFVIGLIMALVWFSISVNEKQAYLDEQVQVIKNRVEFFEKFFEERGISVPVAGYEELAFPTSEPEDENAKFGITQAERDGQLITIRLALEDGELVVYGTDGARLDPIPVAD